MATRKSTDSGERGGSGTFTAEEKAAIKEYAAEKKAARKRAGSATKAAEEAQSVVDKIAELSGDDKRIAEGIHELVLKHAPDLAPRLWYGMPAYAKDGKVLCFVQPASKFKARYLTLGFQDVATLDDGAMWATSFAVAELGPDERRRIGELLRKAAG